MELNFEIQVSVAEQADILGDVTLPMIDELV